MRQSIRFAPWIMALAMIFWCAGSFAHEPFDQKNPHNPYTFEGLYMRGDLRVPAPSGLPGQFVRMGPVLFQEIAPCKWISTLDADNYPPEFGGEAFTPYERRSYAVTGLLTAPQSGQLAAAAMFVNPCSEQIPTEARAVAVRVHTVAPDNEGTVWLAPTYWGIYGTGDMAKIRALDFHPNMTLVEESGVMIGGGQITVEVQNSRTDLVIEVLGYFEDDPELSDLGSLVGPPGPQGEKGEKAIRDCRVKWDCRATREKRAIRDCRVKRAKRVIPDHGDCRASRDLPDLRDSAKNVRGNRDQPDLRDRRGPRDLRDRTVLESRWSPTKGRSPVAASSR